MIPVILSRLVRGLPLLLAATLIAFVLDDAGSASGATPPERYARFVLAVLRGDFGVSQGDARPVAAVLLERLPATAELLGAALVVALLGLPAGLLAAMVRDARTLRGVAAAARIAVALPVVSVGCLLLVFAAISGTGPAPFGSGRLALVLPALTVALLPAAALLRQTRAGMAAALDSGAIRFAQARGMPPEAVLRHAVPNALLPVAAAAARHAGALLAGCVVAEAVFQWPGLGLLLARAAATADAPVLAAVLLLLAGVFLALDLLGFAACVALDPRLRPARAALAAAR